MIVLHALRSLVFNLFTVGWTLLMGLAFLPLLVLPQRWMIPGIRLWALGIIASARVIVGITWRVEGIENLPDGPLILASKHQSAWETLFFPVLLSRPVFILKKELLSLPVIGWYMRRGRMIAIDRKAGGAALKQVLRGAERVLGEGGQIILFPEGTRVAPGATKPYQPGIAALYHRFGDRGVPVVPVTLNSGTFWARQAWIKRPGEVVVKIFPPLPPGLPKDEFLETLRQTIDGPLLAAPPPQDESPTPPL